MAWCLIGADPLLEAMLTFLQLNPQEQTEITYDFSENVVDLHHKFQMQIHELLMLDVGEFAIWSGGITSSLVYDRILIYNWSSFWLDIGLLLNRQQLESSVDMIKSQVPC